MALTVRNALALGVFEMMTRVVTLNSQDNSRCETAVSAWQTGAATGIGQRADGTGGAVLGANNGGRSLS